MTDDHSLRYERLLRDAQARQRGKNLDGSPRREARPDHDLLEKVCEKAVEVGYHRWRLEQIEAELKILTDQLRRSRGEST